MTTFDADTALQRIDAGRFEGRLHPDWSIVRGANGGHLAAILLRAMTLGLDDPERQPRSLTVHFMRVPRNETFEVHTTVERNGRTMSNLSARMVQQDKLIAVAIAAYSTPRTSDMDFSDLVMPEAPRPETLERTPDRDDFPFGKHFDYRPALGPDVGTPHARVTDSRAERAELGLWIRLRDPRLVEHTLAAQFMDAFAPAVFAKLARGGGGAGVPTVEMTFHFRESLPLAGAGQQDWYLGLFRTLTSRDGFIEEDGWLWHEGGTLVAQSRQLALLM